MLLKSWLWCIFFLPMLGIAQMSNSSPVLVQFSGMVFDTDGDGTLPYTTFTNLSYQNRVAIANYKGYFSFVVREGDTLEVSCIGYYTRKVIIPHNLSEQKYTLMLKLKPEIKLLKEVKVFPWSSVEEFNKEFLTMKVVDDDWVLAKKNIENQQLDFMLQNLPRDGQEQMGYYFQNQHYSQLYKAAAPSNPLLNPFAWGAFLNKIVQGDKSRKKY